MRDISSPDRVRGVKKDIAYVLKEKRKPNLSGVLSRLPPLSQRLHKRGQLGLEPSGKDSEQLLLESDRELKMELREDACGHGESRGRNTQGVRLLLGAQVSSTGFSRLRSGRDERVVQGDSGKGQRVSKE